jgi:dCTP diphosphatase
MSNTDLTARLRTFARERDWEQFHEPRSLLLALVGEVGELAELFQWRTDEDIRELVAGRESRRPVEDELADINIYLVRLADVLGVDLDGAIEAKLAANEAKYPVERAKGSAAKYTEYDQ